MELHETIFPSHRKEVGFDSYLYPVVETASEEKIGDDELQPRSKARKDGLSQGERQEGRARDRNSTRICLCGHGRWEHEKLDLGDRGPCTQFSWFAKCKCQEYVPSSGRDVEQRVKRQFTTKAERMEDFPFAGAQVWNAVHKAFESIGWKVEAVDPATHTIRARAKPSLLAWSSTLLTEVSSTDESNSKVSVSAETVQAHDLGRTRRRIDIFFHELQDQLQRTDVSKHR